MITPLGKKIKDLRTEKGYTLEELADKSDSSKSYIWELENRNPPRPSGDKLAKIAKALGVTTDYLLSEKQGAPTGSVIDQAFFRDYQDLDEPTKKKLRDLVEMWGSKP